MVEQQREQLLHLYSRHTNLSIPYSDYVSCDKFPEQNKILLDGFVPIRYRNMYMVDDDNLSGPDLIEPHDIYVANCRVLRCDSAEPYHMICISDDYRFMFVTDSRYYKETVVQYPIQFSQLVGITVRDQYPGIIPEIKGITLRVDNGEPCYSIIEEFLEDNIVRFLIGDECFSKLYDYHDAPDYDGKDSKDYGKYTDVDGGKVDKTVGALFTSIDGGPADILHEIFKTFKTEKEIADIRKMFLEGKKIYDAD